jgi:protocatechuate 3,4-dioxygenase beta subunit
MPHPDHDLGLQADLQTLLRQRAHRRHALRWLAGGSLGALLAGCGGGGEATETASGTGSGSSGSSASCSVIPEETAGPYPGDGSNGSGGSIANALLLSGIVRSDIRSSVDDASGTAAGVPLTVTLTLVNTNGSCASLAGYAIYLWHCDAQGRYSMYSSGITDENYLRGVQVTDANGEVSFTTIVPGCYSGRWPHMHFEIYRSETTATSYSNKLKTSQLALPQAVCEAVYAESAYAGSAANLRQISLSSDNIFSDGVDTQMATVSGSASAGYAATLQVGIAV